MDLDLVQLSPKELLPLRLPNTVSGLPSLVLLTSRLMCFSTR